MRIRQCLFPKCVEAIIHDGLLFLGIVCCQPQTSCIHNTCLHFRGLCKS